MLRFTPKIFTLFGLHKNSVTLRLDGQNLASIPYELSVAKASLLAILNDREISHFKEALGLPAKLVVFRWYKDESNPETFHIPVKVDGFHRPNPDSAYCLVNLTLIRIPHELKELLVTHFFDADQADAFVSHLKDVPFRDDDIQAVFHSHYLSLQKERCLGEHLKILAFSVKSVRLFGEISGSVPAVGEKVEFLPHKGDQDCIVSGLCTDLRTFPELPGFFLMDVDQTLSLEVVKKLMKHTKKAGATYLNLG